MAKVKVWAIKPRYAPGSEVIYVADALSRQLHKDNAAMCDLAHILAHATAAKSSAMIEIDL